MMSIRKAMARDVAQMVELSEQKRSQYEAFQPLFWRKAQASRQLQHPFFERQLSQDEIAALVHEGASGIDGFIIADLREGRQCSVDDFALADPSAWQTVGAELLRRVAAEAKRRNICQCEVVCGHLDQPKRAMLSGLGLTLERYWYTAAVDATAAADSPYHVRTAAATDAPQMAQVAGQSGRGYPEIGQEHALVLICADQGTILGYASAVIVPAPPVYDPGGPTCLVLESRLAEPQQWHTAGQALLNKVAHAAAARGAVQYVVVCAADDQPKQTALASRGLAIASEWYVGPL